MELYNNKQFKLSLTDVDIDLSTKGHVNKLPFIATVMQINSPSDGAPFGTDKPVQIGMEEATKSVDSLNLMAIDCRWYEWCPEECMTGHDRQNKIGVIESAYIEGTEIKIKGIVYCNDFPDIAFFIKNATRSLGFSVEVYSDLEDKGEYYEMEDSEFTGVAILFSNLAAFQNTYIDQIAAAKRKGIELDENTKKEFRELVESIMTGSISKVEEKVTDITTQISAMKAEIEKKPEPKVDDETVAENEKLKTLIESMKAENSKALEDMKAKNEELTEKIAQLEASRSSAGKGNPKGQFDDDDFGKVWDKGYTNGAMMAFQKLSEKVKKGNN